MKQKPKTITDTENEKLLAYFEQPSKTDHQKYQFYRNRMMIMIMLDAGLRVSEVSKLTLGMILYQDKIAESISITKAIAKYKHARTIPMSLRLKNELILFSVWFGPFSVPQSTQPVFAKGPGGTALTQRQIQRIIKAASLNSIGRAISPHALRHTFATRMIKVANIKVVQQLLGHANMATTEIYLHPDHQDLTNAIGKLGTNGKT